MADEVKATETVTETIAAPEDLEAKVAALEAEKAVLLREAEKGANYRVAYLKENKKNKDENEDDEDKMRRIASEAVAGSRLAEIAREQDAIIKKALKENKELKLAQMNKVDIPVSTSTHTETSTVVRDTLVTPEQIASFKAMGWDDAKIARYKKNLVKNAR